MSREGTVELTCRECGERTPARTELPPPAPKPGRPVWIYADCRHCGVPIGRAFSSAADLMGEVEFYGGAGRAGEGGGAT